MRPRRRFHLNPSHPPTPPRFLGNAGHLTIDADMQFGLTGVSQSETGTLTLTHLTPRTTPLFANLHNPSVPVGVYPNTLSAAGTLAVELDPTYTPQPGDTFLLFSSPTSLAGRDAPTVTGQFSTYDLPTLPAGLSWQPLYTSTSFSLQIIPEPATALAFLALPLLPRRQRQ